jgi:hypothetical protein
METGKKADRYEDGTAPLTRAQRNAILALPAGLLMSALHVWDSLNGPADLPGKIWLSLSIAVLVIGVYSIFWLSAGEKRDEREVLIKLKAMRTGFIVLIAGNLLILPRAENQLHDAIAALFFFTVAVTSASILFYSRRSA